MSVSSERFTDIAKLLYSPLTDPRKTTTDKTMADHQVTNGPISVSNKVSENDQKGLLNTQMNSNDVDTQIELFSLHLSSVASVLALFIIIAALCCCWWCSKRKNWARILNWCCVKRCTISEEALQTGFQLKIIDENQ